MAITWSYLTQYEPTNQIPQSGLKIEFDEEKKILNFLYLLNLPDTPDNRVLLLDLLAISNPVERLNSIRDILSSIYEGTTWDTENINKLIYVLTDGVYLPVGIYYLDNNGIFRPTLTDVKNLDDYYNNLPSTALHWFEYAIALNPLLFFSYSLSKPFVLISNSKQRCNSQF